MRRRRQVALAVGGALVLLLVGVTQFLPQLIDRALGARDIPPPQMEVTPVATPEAFPHSLLDAVLQEHVTPAGTVDYGKLGADARLGRYVAHLARYSPASHPKLFPTRAHELAYWCNAYNALVLYGVTKHWPIASVRDVQVDAWVSAGEGQGFFYALKFTLGGQRINLYDLENKTIRGYGDARIHAAINCASLGCPVLDRHAFMPDTLDAHFDRLMRSMVAEDRNLTVDHGARTLRASAIFDWFAEDFGDPLAYWISFSDPAGKAELERARDGAYSIEFVDYDWGINLLGSR